MAALKLLQQAEPYIPSSPELISLKEHISACSCKFETTPQMPMSISRTTPILKPAA